MDGTIYLGDKVFPYAIDFIKRLRENGRRVLFFTNNASRSPERYLNRLTDMGFEPSADEIMTSGDVTARFLLSHRTGKSVYIVGTDDLIKQFRASGIKIVSNEDVKAGEKADIVVVSFDTTLDFEKLTNACRLIKGGSEFFSTHPDLTCPVEEGFVPDSGATCAYVTSVTGVEPTYFGKPYVQTIEMICEYAECSKDEMCVLGDRLYTDIALGKLHGVTSILVLTGETSMADVEAAESEKRPDLIFPSLYEVDREMFGKHL